MMALLLNFAIKVSKIIFNRSRYAVLQYASSSGRRSPCHPGKRIHYNQRNKQLFFLPPSSGDILSEIVASRVGSTPLAPLGQMRMHLMQLMHFSGSVSFGFMASMADTGHFLAHSPHSEQDSLPKGFKGDPPNTLYVPCLPSSTNGPVKSSLSLS